MDGLRFRLTRQAIAGEHVLQIYFRPANVPAKERRPALGDNLPAPHVGLPAPRALSHKSPSQQEIFCRPKILPSRLPSMTASTARKSCFRTEVKLPLTFSQTSCSPQNAVNAPRTDLIWFCARADSSPRRAKPSSAPSKMPRALRNAPITHRLCRLRVSKETKKSFLSHALPLKICAAKCLP